MSSILGKLGRQASIAPFKNGAIVTFSAVGGDFDVAKGLLAALLSKKHLLALAHCAQRSKTMNATLEQALICKLRTLSAQQVAEVEDFVEFLAGKARKAQALDRLLAIAPALEDAGVAPISEEEIAAEVKAARTEHRAREQAKASGAGRS